MDPSEREHPGGLLNKVPEVTLAFWVIKIMSTTVGETGADYLAVHVGLGTLATDAIMLASLGVALSLQLRAVRYIPWRYWLTVVLVSIVGTQITDALTDGMGISLYLSTSVFAVALAATFAVWYAIERSLSIHTIVTRRRELFYWLAILFTFALGTAAGDLATEALRLGFTVGVVIFGALIAGITAAYYLGANSILAFWAAYVLTRPLGASLGDLLSQDRGSGGLGAGTVATSAVFLVVIVALVVGLTVAERRLDGVRASGTDRPAAVVTGRRKANPMKAAQAIAAGLALFGILAFTVNRVTPILPRPAANASAVPGLGDLFTFRSVIVDTLSLVDKGDLAGAKARIKDLETSWDDAEASLKPRAPSDWHKIDKAIDKALAALRADNPSQAACRQSLADLLLAIDTEDTVKD